MDLKYVLDIGLDMTIQGMGTTFLILILLYFLIKGLSLILVPRKK
ncbi:OadG family transporter subunit [Sporosalibacterium faouarense]|nr:OadG family transporter subunit [Sporosalibacterium faouarense]MTI48269.1 hypothetical protein [Bacillota bacterium]